MTFNPDPLHPGLSYQASLPALLPCVHKSPPCLTAGRKSTILSCTSTNHYTVTCAGPLIFSFLTHLGHSQREPQHSSVPPPAVSLLCLSPTVCRTHTIHQPVQVAQNPNPSWGRPPTVIAHHVHHVQTCPRPSGPMIGRVLQCLVLHWLLGKTTVSDLSQTNYLEAPTSRG